MLHITAYHTKKIKGNYQHNLFRRANLLGLPLIETRA